MPWGIASESRTSFDWRVWRLRRIFPAGSAGAMVPDSESRRSSDVVIVATAGVFIAVAHRTRKVWLLLDVVGDA
jgi:hypothetical protein